MSNRHWNERGLPGKYGTLWWRGTSEDRALQPKMGPSTSDNYYEYVMPDRAERLDPTPLTSAEQRAADTWRGA